MSRLRFWHPNPGASSAVLRCPECETRITTYHADPAFGCEIRWAPSHALHISLQRSIIGYQCFLSLYHSRIPKHPSNYIFLRHFYLARHFGILFLPHALCPRRTTCMTETGGVAKRASPSVKIRPALSGGLDRLPCATGLVYSSAPPSLGNWMFVWRHSLPSRPGPLPDKFIKYLL
jgi:hypothetical protein